MEISKCYLLPNICIHYPKCIGMTMKCGSINEKKCVHAVIYKGVLQVMEGKDLYKLIDKKHPEYQHLYELYDEKYLEFLRNKQVESENNIRQEKFKKIRLN